MTNKEMPVVGKRYKTIGGEAILTEVSIKSDGYRYKLVRNDGSYHTLHSGSSFPEGIEEISDDSQQANQSQVKESMIVDPLGQISLRKKLDLQWAKTIEERNGWIEKGYTEITKEFAIKELGIDCKFGGFWLIKEPRKENVLSDEVREAMEGLKRGVFDFRSKLLITNIDDTDACSKFVKQVQNLLNALEAMEKSDIPEKGDCGIVEYTEKNLDISGVTFVNNLKEFEERLKSGELPIMSIGDKQEEAEKEVKEVNINSNNVFITKEKNPELFKEEQPQSIWKDVSELPKQHDNVHADIPCIILDKQGYYRFGLFSIKNFFEHNGRLLELGKYHEPVKYCTLKDYINHIDSLEQRIKKLEEK